MIGNATANTNEQARRDRHSGSVWDYVSPSRLNLFLKCPLAFRLKYIDGIRSPTTPALFLGKRVHAGLETYYRHRMLGIMLSAGDVADRMSESWGEAMAEDAVQFDSVAEECATRQQAVDLVAAYFRHLPEDEPAPRAVEVTLEHPLVDPLTGEDLGIPLLGVIDLILPAADSAAVIDFKTSSRSAPPFAITHEIQLTSYAYLFRAATGENEAGLEIRSLIKTKRPKVDSHPYEVRHDDHFRRFFAVVREYLDALKAGRFNYSPGWACSTCEHRDGPCRRWCGQEHLAGQE